MRLYAAALEIGLLAEDPCLSDVVRDALVDCVRQAGTMIETLRATQSLLAASPHGG